MKAHYVVLTGGKNNAGDFLIKYRAKQLFSALKEEREIIDMNAWEAFDTQKLKTVNDSKALILLGGPSLQKNMRPDIYKMTDNLDDITVPIISMGIGWKSMNGEWRDTYTYPLREESISLLERIEQSGYLSSVRDYHTLNSIRFKGFDHFIMTGCPAYYDLERLGESYQERRIQKVAFSLGVSFISSRSMLQQMQEAILRCKTYFDKQAFTVVFHHSLDEERFMATHGASQKHNEKHRAFASWLEAEGIDYKDVSGSAENLMDFYADIDLHIGYRVHAHIFMNSINRLSILIGEDGRAKAVKDVIGGIVLDGFWSFKSSFSSKVWNRLLDRYDRYQENPYLAEEIEKILTDEKNTYFSRMKSTRGRIDTNFQTMQQFIAQLP